jgi:putative oxidoreductase
MSRAAEIAFTLLRLVIGFLFACHGAQKLFGVLGGEPQLHGLMLVGGIVEFGGGLLVGLGLFARVAAFLASGEMASAYFMAHAPHGFWPILNHGELAVAYCFVMLFIAANGAGPYSLDAMLGRKRT